MAPTPCSVSASCTRSTSGWTSRQNSPLIPSARLWASRPVEYRRTQSRPTDGDAENPRLPPDERGVEKHRRVKSGPSVPAREQGESLLHQPRRSSCVSAWNPVASGPRPVFWPVCPIPRTIRTDMRSSPARLSVSSQSIFLPLPTEPRAYVAIRIEGRGRRGLRARGRSWEAPA